MFTETTLARFIENTASDQPVPGGGSVSALAGALAAALAQMVAGLTRNKPKYAAVHGEMAAITDRTAELRQRLLWNVDADAAAYNAVLEAFRMPKATDAEKAARDEAIQAALKTAAEVPMAVAQDAAEVLDMAGAAMKNGLASARTDALVGVMMARSAALGALMNVSVNLADIQDADFVARMERSVAGLRTRVMDLEAAVLKGALG